MICLELGEHIVLFQFLYAIFETRMSRESWITFCDHECREIPIFWHHIIFWGEFLELFQGCYHVFFASELWAPDICSVLSYPREPHDDQACEHTEDDLEYYRYDRIRKMRYSFVFFSSSQKWSDESSENLGEQDHERIEYSSYESQRHHITIEYMRHLMSDDSFDFWCRHGVEKSGRYCYERTIFRSTSGECIGLRRFVVSDFRHVDSFFMSDPFDGSIYSLKVGIIGMKLIFGEESDIVGSFCLPSRDEKWYDRSSESEESRE